MVVKSRSLAAFLLWSAAGWAQAGPVNVNTADASTLADELNGVGPARAAAIVAFRQEYGPFKAADDLTKVKGIGEAILEKNRSSILLSDPSR
jgi:competence protein ComEA